MSIARTARSARVLTAAILLSLVVLLCAASARAATAATIHACVKPKSGVTRIVSAKTKCRHGEQKLSWNTAGPQGTPGLAGANGLEGKAGPTGVGPVYSVASGEGGVKLGTETIVLSKVVPPGSYEVSGKTFVAAEATTKKSLVVICALIDTPGTTASTTGTNSDTAFWSTPLLEETPTEFIADTTLPLEGTLTSKVTSTLTLGCGVESASAPVVNADFAKLQALSVSAVM